MSLWTKELTPLSDIYEKICEIGEGAYGKVYKGQNIISKEFVAMKLINRQFGEGFPFSSIREIALLKSVKHKNIVNLIEVVTDRNLDVYLVFDYAEYDLDYILKSISLEENYVKSYMRQLLLGLYVLHSKNIYHRDLKPKNILVKATNIIEIADFGLAKQISPIEREKRKKPMSSTVITIYYRPLELFFKVPKYGPEVDIWSLGCIFYEMIMRKPLFYTKEVKKSNSEEMNEMYVVQQIFSICGVPTEKDWPGWKSLSENSKLFQSEKIESTGDLDSYLTSHPTGKLPSNFMGAKPLLLAMLQLNPAKRLSIEQLLTNEYLRNFENSLDPQRLPRLKIHEQSENQKKHKQKVENLHPVKPVPR